MFLKRAPRYISGFTIIEVMVTVAIIAILSAILMYQFKGFDSKLLLKNLAYEIAIVLREAQVYGVSVQGSGADFEKAYGVHFEVGTHYTLFRDNNNNGIFDSDEMLSTYTIGRGNSIVALCIDGSCVASSSIDVTFKRPDSDASFARNGTLLPSARSVFIRVGSATSNLQVMVNSTGQISI